MSKTEVVFIKGAWKVFYQGRMTKPDFNSKGAALAYIDILDRGQRLPEWI